MSARTRLPRRPALLAAPAFAASPAHAGRGVAGSLVQRLRLFAWQVVGNSEDASHAGVARPNQPFTVGGAGWGAFGPAARYGEPDIDDDAFPRFAATSANGIDARTIGLNEHLTRILKLITHYTEATFDSGAMAGTGREKEKTVFAHPQVPTSVES